MAHQPIGAQPLVDSSNNCNTSSTLHNPNLHGPADNCSYHQQEGKQTQGILICLYTLHHFCTYQIKTQLSFCYLVLLFQKGCGYHLDLFMVGIMLGVCSVMGLPWFVAATVLSITHVNSLKLESECSAPGEQPKFLGIREQRVTGLMIFMLMGSSVFMTSVLKVGQNSFIKKCFLWLTYISLIF